MVKILLNTKPFGKFIISQLAFSRILAREYLRIVDGKSEIVQQVPLKVFNEIHGLEWSSENVFFTEKIGEYRSHSVLPIFLRRDVVYYFQDSVRKNKLTTSRHHPSVVETFEELGEEFNGSELKAKIFTVPFVKDLAIGVDKEGKEYYYYFQ